MTIIVIPEPKMEKGMFYMPSLILQQWPQTLIMLVGSLEKIWDSAEVLLIMWRLAIMQ